MHVCVVEGRTKKMESLQPLATAPPPPRYTGDGYTDRLTVTDRDTDRV